jgi:hypothetical protein
MCTFSLSSARERETVLMVELQFVSGMPERFTLGRFANTCQPPLVHPKTAPVAPRAGVVPLGQAETIEAAN